MKTIQAIDLFCGAGGTSTGLMAAARAMGLDVSLTAVNHWDVAIETHSKNHPEARHLCENLHNIDPRKLFPDRRVRLLTASPECTHFSNARGGVPCSDQSRSSGWHIVRWAEALYIDNILIENVPEFLSWGPLGADGKPMPSMRGRTFRAFVGALESLGYRCSWRIVNTADYGDPTCRNRFFMLCRRGNKRILWPDHTHSEQGGPDLFGETRKWVPARSIIDWSIQGESIFNRKKPLAQRSMDRIIHGLKTFGGKNAQSIEKPIDTITTRDRFGLVSTDSNGLAFDIRYRMLQPHELAAAQSFPAGYHFCGTKTEKIKQIGNAVPVKTAEALCGALLKS